jgi:hypothetical protein
MVAPARARGVNDTRAAAIVCRLPLLAHPPQSFSAEFRWSLLAAPIDGITGTVAGQHGGQAGTEFPLLPA